MTPSSKKEWIEALWAMLVFGAIIFAIVCLIGIAYARDPTGKYANSPFHQWFQSLKSPITGGSCCSEADCQRTEYRMGKDGYEAHIGDSWVKIPDSVVLHISNPVGEAVVCTIGDTILCFVPTLET